MMSDHAGALHAPQPLTIRLELGPVLRMISDFLALSLAMASELGAMRCYRVESVSCNDTAPDYT
jgi:hypothetical protein